MSLSIYTYSNPYEICNELYWDSIKNCAHFCVSQTMVNGLITVYKELGNGQLATVEELVEAIYPHWFDTKTYIEQYTLLTNVLDSVNPTISELKWKRVKQSLKFNKSALLDSIRLLCEMGIDFSEIKIEKVSEEQSYLAAAYKNVLESDDKDKFKLQAVFTEKEIDKAIKTALVAKALRVKKEPKPIENIDCESVVIHGVHQFTPTILSAIEQVAKYKRVILLFNYQEQYKEIYQTWIDVYSCFDINIKGQFINEFKPTSLLRTSYVGNLLADALAKFANGSYETRDPNLDGISVLEFDNITEFSAYVAKIYEKAKKKLKKSCDDVEGSPLLYMEEQFYSANSDVNDILKVYFPEQFGERHFLSYPIGHFFIAVTNMWDSENGGIKIQNLNDIAECLYSEALPEHRRGSLITTFNATKNYYSRETDLEGIIDLLKKLKKQKKKIACRTIECATQLQRLNYFNVSDGNLEELIEALTILDSITKLFYEDFENEENNFKHFYEKVREFVQQQVFPKKEAESEFQDIILRLLARLQEAEEIEGSSSFDCLKETMFYYLKQEKVKGQSANWIVRDFQQIDGDVLKSYEQSLKNPELIYHFACVSDADMTVDREEQFPWPLNLEFFEKAYEPLDWKYQVYVKASREFKHFKRYALIYGLEFNRCKFKLSFVKNVDGKENELYYLLKLLDINTEENQQDTTNKGSACNVTVDLGLNKKEFNKEDVFRRRICSYKFALETIIEGSVRYKDRFLQSKYFEILLFNRMRIVLEGQIATEGLVNIALDGECDELKRYFKFLNESELIDIKMNVKNSLQHQILQNGKLRLFPRVNPQDEEYMIIKEEFIYRQLKNDKDENVLQGKFGALSEKEKDAYLSEGLKEERYVPSVNIWCQWCADREICLEYYKSLVER